METLQSKICSQYNTYLFVVTTFEDKGFITIYKENYLASYPSSRCMYWEDKVKKYLFFHFLCLCPNATKVKGRKVK